MVSKECVVVTYHSENRNNEHVKVRLSLSLNFDLLWWRGREHNEMQQG